MPDELKISFDDNSDSNPTGPIPSAEFRPITPVPAQTRLGPEQISVESKEDTEKAIGRIAKSFEPMVSRLVDSLDSIGCRTVGWQAGKYGYPREEIELLEEKATMREETHSLMVTSASRIAARNVKDPATLDYIGLAGSLTDWLSGLIIVIREIKMARPNIKPKS